MIDSHCHTEYSKHATGSVDKIVASAIAAGIKILTITDHAPFPVQGHDRLQRSELDAYFREIENVAYKYKGDIKLLTGLEFDYLPGTEKLTEEMMNCYPLDYAIGSVHYCELKKNEFIPTYALGHLNNDRYLDVYFNNLQRLINSKLFDSIGHPDVVLRGCSEDKFERRMISLIDKITESGIAYEINASGYRKQAIDPVTKNRAGYKSYPHWKTVETIVTGGGKFVVGSDAHSPRDVGYGLSQVYSELARMGQSQVSVFINREEHKFSFIKR